MKAGMWPAVVGALLCVRLVGAQSVEMNTKPLTISPGAEAGNRIRVKWMVRQEASVVLQVVDATGKAVRTLDAGRMAPGEYNAVLDGKSFLGKPLPAGEYVIRLSAGFKPEADMSFGANGLIGCVTRKFTFKGDRKLDVGTKGFDVQTVKAKVDGEAWDREEDFGMGGDTFRADSARGIIELNPQATLNNGAEIEVRTTSGVPLENPWALACAPDGSLYIGDFLTMLDIINKLPKPRNSGYIYKVDAAGKPVADFGKNGALPVPGLAVATDADGNLYAIHDHTVDVYDAKGVRKYGIAGYLATKAGGLAPQSAFWPASLALNESKRMVIDNINPSNLLYDATKPDFTGFIAVQDPKSGATSPPVAWQYFGPCVAATGDFFYETTYVHNLYKYRFDQATGQFSTIWFTPVQGIGGKHQGPEKIWNGIGVELDRTGLIYVADRDNHRIQVFFDAGTSYKHVGSFGSEGSDAAKCQMMAPHGICLSPDGKFLYVADDGIFIKLADNPVTHGLARVTKLKLGFGEVVEAKLTIK